MTRSIRLPGRSDLVIGLERKHLVEFGFVDATGAPVDPQRVESLLIANDRGEVMQPGATEPTWLIENRIMRVGGQLSSVPIEYRLQEVGVRGSNVVDRGRLHFSPDGAIDTWVVPLLLYSLTISGQDALFGYPVGTSVQLVHPNGSSESVPLDERASATISALPRGNYQALVEHPPGFPVSTPLVLSRDQSVRVPVVSYVDAVFLLGTGSSVAIALVLAGGRPVGRAGRRGLRRIGHAGRDAPAPSGEPGSRSRPRRAHGWHSPPPAGDPTLPRPRANTDGDRSDDDVSDRWSDGHRARRFRSARRQRARNVRDEHGLGTQRACPPIRQVPLLRQRGDMESSPVSDLRSAAPEVMSAPRRLAGPRLHLVLMVLATFGASLLITVLLLAAVAARPAVPTAHDAPVLAYYYIWFDRGSWDRAKTDMPILGAYSSSSRQVMREHIEWAKSAGIDGFIVSWKSTEKLDARLRQLVEVARDADFKLAIIYQGLDFDRNPVPVAQVGRDLASFAAEFASDPVFQIRDRPLVVWSGTWEFSRSEIESVTSEVRPTLRVLASEKDVDGINRLAGVVDGDAYYWSSVDPETFPNYVDKLTAMSAVVHSQGGLWIVPVATGFDARLIGGTRVITRDDGEHLRRQMGLIAQTRPDAIGLISWNEFSENSHIEPSVGHGYRYLDVVREARPLAGLAPMDEDSSDDPASDDPALAQRLLAVSLLGIVTLLGVVMTVRRERRVP